MLRTTLIRMKFGPAIRTAHPEGVTNVTYVRYLAAFDSLYFWQPRQGACSVRGIMGLESGFWTPFWHNAPVLRKRSVPLSTMKLLNRAAI